MVRRIASQVHQQTSRLLRQHYIKREPAWYQAVLDNPPLPLPPRAPPPRTPYDLPQPRTAVPTSARTPKPHPKPIQYIEDTIRRQFFQDHPFEAFRATTLLEGGAIEPEHPVQGLQWTRLRQRGRNPSPEDAVRYAVNLHDVHKISLTEAYASAVAQFRALRSEQHIARTVALLEARAYGVHFGPTQVQIAFKKEDAVLDTWQKNPELDAGANAARKRWKAVADREDNVGEWSRGQDYVRLWKEGVRPTYAPQLVTPAITSAGLSAPAPAAIPEQHRAAKNKDFMQVIGPRRRA